MLVVDDRPAAGEIRPVVRVCVTTYERNGPLGALLDRLRDTVVPVTAARVGVVVVDDNPDGRARSVAEAHADSFELGLDYRHTGSRNISTARNEALVGGMAGVDGATTGDFIAMIDDDCEPSPQWINELLAVQRRSGADLVTGAREYRAAPGSPSWFAEQGFSLDADDPCEDGGVPVAGHTANVLMSVGFLRRCPSVRFRTELGRTGGEDMVFFGAAEAAGARHRYSAAGLVTERVPLERTTMRSLLRYSLWFGNNEAVINRATGGTSRRRLALRGGRRVVEPLAQTLAGSRGRPRPWRRALFDSVRGLGLLAGVVGVRVNHH